MIEKMPTTYQAPDRKIDIINSGEFSLCPKPEDEEDYVRHLHPTKADLFRMDYDKSVDGDAVSVTSEKAYREGRYCLASDLRSYFPFKRYSTMFEYLKEIERTTVAVEAVVVEKEEHEADDAKQDGGCWDKKAFHTVDSIERLITVHKIIRSGSHLMF